jgi:hypothetical protein
MTSHDDEANWAELADALGIDTPATQARKQAQTPPEPPPLPADPIGFEDLPDAHEQEGDTLLEPLLAVEPAAEEPAGEGEGDGDKKRRRRRRRRRKPGAGEPATAGAEADGGDDEGDDLAPGFSSDSDAETEDEEGEPEPVGVGIADEPTPDAVRELISNWNVPSWQDIVSGLYRPGGGGDR